MNRPPIKHKNGGCAEDGIRENHTVPQGGLIQNSIQDLCTIAGDEYILFTH